MTSVKCSSILGRPLLVIALLAMSIVFWFLERSSLSWGFSWHYGLAAILVAWYLRTLIRNNSEATLSSFYQLFYYVGMLVSAAIVASGAEMIEIHEQGTANGFFWLMLGFFVAGTEATFLGYRSGNLIWLRQGALRFPAGVDRAIILAFILPVLLLSAYVFIRTGGPILSGVDRVTFWRTLAPPGTSILRSLLTQSFFFVAYLYLWRHRLAEKMLLPRLILLAYILAGLLVLGEKLSLFIILLNIWLIVLAGVLPEFRFSMKHVILAGIIAVLLLITVALTYIFLEDRDGAFILVRAALQSQLLWSVVEDPAAFSLLPQRPECYFGCGWLESGADYISFRYLPLYLYNFYDEVGSGLSGFMPALPILTIGSIPSLLLHCVICFGLGITQRKIVAALAARQPLYGFLLFKLQLGITMVWITANTGPLPGLLATLVVILLYRFICVAQADMSHASQQRT